MEFGKKENRWVSWGFQRVEQSGTQQTPRLRKQRESTEGLDCDPQNSSPAGPQTVTMFGDTARKEVIQCPLEGTDPGEEG